MAIQFTVTSKSEGSKDFSFVLARYLEALRADSFQSLENRTVNTLVAAWKAAASGTPQLPVRLSDAVEEFDICKRPRILQGQQDGDISFDEELKRFQITLYSTSPELRLTDLAQRHPRMRFTYAHEVAHRFCYTLQDERWLRARDLATDHLNHAVQLQHRITLGRREEGFCNNVARRVLVPEEYMTKICNVEEWLKSGPEFSLRLSHAARQFGVSWQCLFVSLQRSLPLGLPDPYCVMTVGRSAGPVTQRGRIIPRLITGHLPESARNRDVKWHPGLDLAKLGDATSKVIADLLEGRQRDRGDVELVMRFSNNQGLRLRGWYRIVGAGLGVATSVVVWGETSWEG